MGNIEAGSVVALTWVDILHEDDVTEYEATRLQPSEATSYGQLLVDTDEKVVLVETEFTDGDKRGVICLPKCVVKSIRPYFEQ